MDTVLDTLQSRGIERAGSKERGFRYRKRGGGRLTAEDRARIEALKVPPAWSDVLIAPDARARVQAVGRDTAGRLQYRYSAAHTEAQGQRKYERLIQFAQALPAMRHRVEADLRRSGLGRDRVLAGMLRIMSTCFFRGGSEVYAKENGSFGIATLRPKHVKVKGDSIFFDFPGKSGQRQQRELKDRRVAKLVRELLAVPGRDVFKMVLDDGAVLDVRRRHLNEYIREVMGQEFTAKDFRTWAGTLMAACALSRCACVPCENKAKQKKALVLAIKETAQHLGNTPAVCKASYISPRIFECFERGQVVQRAFKDLAELQGHGEHTLHSCERALLAMLTGSPQKARAVVARAHAALPPDAVAA
jgi:DNA topoisomerase-1